VTHEPLIALGVFALMTAVIFALITVIGMVLS